MSTYAPRNPAFRCDAALVVLAALPFFLNDFLFLRTTTGLGWLAADYGSKLLALAIVFALPALRRALAGTRPIRRPLWRAAALALLVAAFVTVADYFFRVVAPIEVEAMVLFKYPKISSPVLYWTDITYGLALTAVSEELIFRGLFARLLARHCASETVLIAASAVFFALIHWSHGLTAMVVAFVAGAALMALYRRTDSLLPPMAAHYLINLWDFI